MSLNLTELNLKIRQNLYNPSNIFRDTLELMDDGGLTVVDTTNPAITLLGWMATQAAVAHDQIDRVSRRKIPEFTKNRKELSCHLDYDSLQLIYATPAYCNVNLVLPINEILESAVKNTDGSSYMIIPRETVFTHSSGTVYGLHFDVMISIIDEDSMDIYYIDNNNPMMTLGAPSISYTKKYSRTDDFNVSKLIV